MPTLTDDIAEREKEIVDEFALFDDWMGKYEHLIEQGDALADLDEQYKTDDYKIRGCQSKVWVRAETENGHVRYTGDSNAKITKGLVALLIRVLNEQPADAIVRADLAFIDEIGMKEHLSPNRQNGLSAMVDQMKLRAASLA